MAEGVSGRGRGWEQMGDVGEVAEDGTAGGEAAAGEVTAGETASRESANTTGLCCG